MFVGTIAEGWTSDGLFYDINEDGKPYVIVSFTNFREGWVEVYRVPIGVPPGPKSVDDLVEELEWGAGSSYVRGMFERVHRARGPRQTMEIVYPVLERAVERAVRLRAPKVKVKYGLGLDEEKALKALFDDIWITVYGSAKGEEYRRRRRQLEARIAEWKRRYRNVERDEAYALAEREMLEWMRGFLIP